MGKVNAVGSMVGEDVWNQVYSIMDCKANFFGPPFLAKTKGEAMRMFDNLVNAGDKNMVSQYPEDFILFSIGDFNLTKGEMVPNVIEHVAKGIDFVKAVK